MAWLHVWLIVVPLLYCSLGFHSQCSWEEVWMCLKMHQFCALSWIITRFTRLYPKELQGQLCYFQVMIMLWLWEEAPLLQLPRRTTAKLQDDQHIGYHFLLLQLPCQGRYAQVWQAQPRLFQKSLLPSLWLQFGHHSTYWRTIECQRGYFRLWGWKLTNWKCAWY